MLETKCDDDKYEVLITDNWDHRLCKTYLEELMGPDQLEGELLLAPEYPIPPNMDYLDSDYLDFDFS